MPASDQRTARIAGLWFIGTFVFSIPALLLYDPVLNDTNYVLGVTAIEIVWELSLAFYLTFRGFRSSSKLLQPQGARADEPSLASGVYA